MKVVVTGASGLLGGHLLAGLAHRGLGVVGLDRHEWWGDEPLKVRVGELATPGFVESSMEQEVPDVVIHCAAMVNVDACERDPEAAYAANAALTRLLVRATPRTSTFVYITTDGIFRGDRPLVDEQEEPAPLTVYGRSKLAGEQEVREATDNHLILRTNFFGWSSGRKQTSAEWVYQMLASGQPMVAFDDFFFTPIYVMDLVDRIQSLIAGRHQGTFHLCGGERVSKHQFVNRMAALAGLSTAAVRRGSIDDAHLAARRPKDMSLSSDRAARALGVAMPGLDDGLHSFLEHRGTTLRGRIRLRPTAAAPARGVST